MQLKTIINRVEKHKGFVYGRGQFNERGELEITVLPDRRTSPRCSYCLGTASLYGRLSQRRYQFVPLWGVLVFLVYSARRVNCKRCGVTVEYLPWSVGKRPLTQSFAWYLSEWAKVLSWTEVARRFHVSWDSVFSSVEMAVIWGRERVSKNGITAIGIDEIYVMKGKFLSLVYQINDGAKRLLWVAEDRKEESLSGFFDWLGNEQADEIAFVCTDMWKPFLRVISRRIPNAVNVLDRFHIKAKLNKAVDEVRAKESRELAKKGLVPVLANSRYCILKRKDNLTKSQAIKLKDLLRYNLRTVRAYLIACQFDLFWSYTSPKWAERFLASWCTVAMRSRIEPLKKFVKTIRSHQPLILNYFKAKNIISLGSVEGLNNKLKVTLRSAYGYRSIRVLQIACYHRLGQLPTPDYANKFF